MWVNNGLLTEQRRDYANVTFKYLQIINDSVQIGLYDAMSELRGSIFSSFKVWGDNKVLVLVIGQVKTEPWAGTYSWGHNQGEDHRDSWEVGGG